MTDYELSLVRMAVEHALKTGAPGIKEAVREVIINNVSIRLRHQLNIPLMPAEATI